MAKGFDTLGNPGFLQSFRLYPWIRKKSPESFQAVLVLQSPGYVTDNLRHQTTLCFKLTKDTKREINLLSFSQIRKYLCNKGLYKMGCKR